MTDERKDLWLSLLLVLMVMVLAFLLSERADGQVTNASDKDFHTLELPIYPASQQQDMNTLHYASLTWSDATPVGTSPEVHRTPQAPLNNPKVTPGAVDASLTRAKLCSPSFHTGTVRDVTESMKKKVCAAYGQKNGCPGPGYEIDHLISIELGGSNDISNLWPQPVDTAYLIGFHTKDKLENQLHRMVCSGTISLPDAQKYISADWYACMKKVAK